MADLTAGQIPKVANVPNGGVGVVTASANIVTLGVNTNGVDVYTAGAEGGRVYGLTGVTDDTVVVNVFVWILDGAVVKPIGLVTIPLSTGNTAAARFNVDFLDGVNILGMPIDNTGKRYIALKAGEKLRAGSLAALTSAKSAWITAQGADYQA
jgi:hypothetical protein